MPIQECWQQQNGSCKMKANHCASALNPILCVSALPTNFLFKGSSFMMNPDFLSCVREGLFLLISVLRSCDLCKWLSSLNSTSEKYTQFGVICIRATGW